MNDYSGVSFKKKWLNNVLDPIIEETGWSRKAYLQHSAVIVDLITHDNGELDKAYRLISKIQQKKEIKDEELRQMMKEVIEESKE